jgi:catechol 2,3-dioxygenase
MAITGVLRPGHVALRVTNLDAAVKHYTNVVGLIETDRDSQGRVYFKAWDEHDHHSLVLREAAGAGMDYYGFRVDSARTLARLGEELATFGCKVQRIPAGDHKRTGERLRFQVPTGHHIELFAQKDKVGNCLPDTNPDPWPDDLRGMAPTRMDHCLLYGTDVDGAVKLFTEVLGFGLAEEVVDGSARNGAFLACANKPHDIAFIRHTEPDKFHHVSFYLNSWGDVLRAADIISKKDVPLDIGPTRHGITRGETIYFFDPAGNRNEVFSGGYIWYPDKPVLHWDMAQLGKGIFYHDRKLNERFLTVLT